MKILFVYDHKYPELWRDGLWAALNLLEKDGFDVKKINLQDYYKNKEPIPWPFDFDFVLGWGAFNSEVDKTIKSYVQSTWNRERIKIGLCLGGYAIPPKGETLDYDVLFYETEWTLSWLYGGVSQQFPPKTELVHAFGVNTDIYKPIPDAIKIWDWASVGAFALWKRQYLLREKGGYRLAIGEIQKDNQDESFSIIGDLLKDDVAVSDMQDAQTLAKIYNSANNVYIPAEIMGGGERAVLEARACGIPVEVEFDNPKLQELTHSPIWNHYYYFDQLKKGILSAYGK